MNSDFTCNKEWNIYTIHNDYRTSCALLRCSEDYAKHLCMLLNQARSGCYSYLYCPTDVWDGKNNSKLLSWELQNGMKE